jgi:hypothetical protein
MKITSMSAEVRDQLYDSYYIHIGTYLALLDALVKVTYAVGDHILAQAKDRSPVVLEDFQVHARNLAKALHFISEGKHSFESTVGVQQEGICFVFDWTLLAGLHTALIGLPHALKSDAANQIRAICDLVDKFSFVGRCLWRLAIGVNARKYVPNPNLAAEVDDKLCQAIDKLRDGLADLQSQAA